ncbi:hypothetical protein [Streptomyces sp.]|uniref:hypothetical protein n=1 Tax=Streptomyces sp. TaxID=1931 RepID=UPI002F957C5B
MPGWIHSDPNADDGYWRDHGQHECARAERCSDPRTVTAGGKTVRLPALTYQAFCPQDRNAIDKALKELPAFQVRVHAEIGSRGQATGPRVSSSKTPPLPINLSVDELLRDLASVLHSWHERVAAVARLSSPNGSVHAACKVLSAHLDALLALPEEPMGRSVWLHEAANLPPGTIGLVHKSAGYADVFMHLDGARAGLEILNLHHRCRRLLGETKLRARRLSGVYCDCGYAELHEMLDAEGQPAGASCRHCRAEYDSEQYADLTKDRADTVQGYRRAPLRAKDTDSSCSGRA